MIAIGLFILAVWRYFWSGKKAVPGSLFGERGEKVIKSIYPYVGIPILCFGLTMLAYGVYASTSGWVETVALTATVLISLVFVASLILFGTIVLFNRPRFLVPPHMRDFDGYLGDLL